ncbi:unnamed protein product, partial [Larinioides sclopetarius]
RISILFYLSEAVYQSISRGFIFGTYCYLRNPWMCFDFIITLVSLPHIEIIKTTKFQLQSLRGIRIFDAITIIPGVRMMGRGVMLSLNGITGVTLLFFTFLTSVSIVSKHIFSGVFRNKCVIEPPKNASFSEFIKDPVNALKDGLCGNLTGARECPSGYICLPNIRDDNQEAHFDKLVSSLINSLAFVTHDDWGTIFDQVCVTIFFVEILIWFVAMGFHYFLSIWNLLDLTVVILGIISISENSLKHTTGFRLFKLLNLLKFQKVWPALQSISAVIVNSLGRIIRLIIVVSLLIFVFAIIGNRVLGRLYLSSKDKIKARWSFKTFEESLFVVLCIFTGEWIQSLWNCMNSTEHSPLCPIIFVSYYLIGNLVIISVFAALLLTSFRNLDLHFSSENKFSFKRCCTYIWNWIDALFQRIQKKSNIDENKKNYEKSPKKTTDEIYTEIKQKYQ